MTLSITVSDLLRSSINRQMIDVRSPSEFAARHIPGAINIPMDQIPVNLSAQHRTGVEASVQHCLIHNTLLNPPKIAIEIGEAVASSA